MSSVTQESLEKLQKANAAKQQKLLDLETTRAANAEQLTLEVDFDRATAEAERLDREIAEADRVSKMREMRAGLPNLDGPSLDAPAGGLALPEGATGELEKPDDETPDPTPDAASKSGARRSSGGAK